MQFCHIAGSGIPPSFNGGQAQLLQKSGNGTGTPQSPQSGRPQLGGEYVPPHGDGIGPQGPQGDGHGEGHEPHGPQGPQGPHGEGHEPPQSPPLGLLTPMVIFENFLAAEDGQQLGFGKHMQAHFPWHCDLGQLSCSPFLLIHSQDIYIIPDLSSRLLQALGWN